MRGIIGFIIMIQGVMGFVGQVFFDGALGILPHWFELPSIAYVGIFALGLAICIWGDADKKRKQKAKEIGGEAA